ncbi:MAG: hypothetical protein KC503_07855, partial [Myxococcales bacterium]|nr:hypothetical protein [Myxococcales bacterium]
MAGPVVLGWLARAASPALALALVVTAHVAQAAPPRADPAFTFDVQGPCPDAATVRRAVQAVAAAARQRFDLRVRATSVGARLELRSTPRGEGAPGKLELTRHLRSHDCSALASAVALIVQARLMALGVLPPLPEPLHSAPVRPVEAVRPAE